MKPILVFPAPQALETPKSVFESPPTAIFQNENCYNGAKRRYSNSS
jgi:hypothetical protein